MGFTQLLPEWETWLKFPFYEEKCRIHPKKYNNVYCGANAGACMEHPVCTRCWNSNNLQHHAHHHPILRVCIASHRAAIHVEDIREFLDISYIQVYNINHKIIIFLNPDKQGQAAKKNPKTPTCVTCHRRLVKNDYGDNLYRFCSISCQIERERPARIIPKLNLKSKIIESCSSPPPSLSLSTSHSPSLSSSLRKRSRKGIPLRAPLQ